jgi:uncharacterized protein
MSENLNYLKDEQSKYLIQHQKNAVSWHPYSPAVIEQAKNSNKPIFLSIGYSSCHWCHVMSDESFNDQEIANYLNDNFMCIKVDKEEHPDIDDYYQQASLLFSKRGGWPLSAFLMPDMSPYFVGTYFPPRGEGEQIGFIDLIKELNRAYTEDYEQVKDNAIKVQETIATGMIPEEPVEFSGHFPPPMSILHALKELRDTSDGGYGEAPKFPLFPYYEWALEQILEGMVDQETGEHIFMSLERMLLGGIYDHARGGLHRYSTDKKWLVPHFEKMLYDQTGLIRVLAKLSIVYSSPMVFDALMQTLHFLKAEMLSDKNYMFASHDADSEGQEGLYFTYTIEEFAKVLAKIEWEKDEEAHLASFTRWFGITKDGNFERGLNIISLDHKLKGEFFTPENWNSIRKIKNGLLEHRKDRIPPATDPKGIASWNFMMITAMVDVMQYCQIDAIRSMATEIFNHLVDGMYDNFVIFEKDGGMQIRHTTTKEDSLPYFEDYVFFAEAQLRIYEITGQLIFKDNCKDTVNFILREFLTENQVKTRAKSTTHTVHYPNQNQTAFDNSHRAAVMTFIGLTRRLSILVKEPALYQQLTPLVEEMTHQTLKNPLNAGEGLRSLTYPTDAYKVVKVPLHWLQDSQFLDFISYFMPRFIFEYEQPDENGKDKPGEHWQLCSSSSCELSGEGIENFISTFRPPTDNDKKEMQEREIRK